MTSNDFLTIAQATIGAAAEFQVLSSLMFAYIGYLAALLSSNLLRS